MYNVLDYFVLWNSEEELSANPKRKMKSIKPET